MNHLIKTKEEPLASVLGPIVAFVFVLQMMGTFSISGLAYGETGSTSCPTNASVVTGGSVQITRNGYDIRRVKLRTAFRSG